MLEEIQRKLIDIINTEKNSRDLFLRVINEIENDKLRELLEKGQKSWIFYPLHTTDQILEELDKKNIDCSHLIKESIKALKKHGEELEKIVNKAKEELKKRYIEEGKDFTAEKINDIDVAYITYNTISLILTNVLIKGAKTEKERKEIFKFFNDKDKHIGYVLRFVLFKGMIDQNPDDKQLAEQYYEMITENDPLSVDLIRIIGRFDKPIAEEYLNKIKAHLEKKMKKEGKSLRESIVMKKMNTNLRLMQTLLKTKQAQEKTISPNGRQITRIKDTSLYQDTDMHVPV